MFQTGRMYLCARCRAQVVVCRRCDRGQIYCPGGCAREARREAQRAAGRRYQSSRQGRFVHAERNRRYRQRQREHCKIVTHQGSVAALAADLLPLRTAVAVIEPASEPPTGPVPGEEVVIESTTSSCAHCGARCAAAVRLGFVRHRRRLFNPTTLAERLIGAHPRVPVDDHWP